MTKTIQVTVKAHPRRPTAVVSVADNGDMVVTIGTLPVMGKANKMLIGLLAEHFKVAPSRLTIVRGHLSSQKMVQVLFDD